MVIHGTCYAVGPRESTPASIQITGGRVTHILADRSSSSTAASRGLEIDLSGFLLSCPALSMRTITWSSRSFQGWPTRHTAITSIGERDIHKKFPDVIAKHRAVPKDVRVWWGAIRNLLCGVTTVCHHNPLWPELRRNDFPVRVVQDYGWAHSLALGGDLRAARVATPEERPFIVHDCEGVDGLAREELWGLDQLGLLDASAVLVHGLAIDAAGLRAHAGSAGSHL